MINKVVGLQIWCYKIDSKPTLQYFTISSECFVAWIFPSLSTPFSYGMTDSSPGQLKEKCLLLQFARSKTLLTCFTPRMMIFNSHILDKQQVTSCDRFGWNTFVTLLIPPSKTNINWYIPFRKLDECMNITVLCKFKSKNNPYWRLQLSIKTRIEMYGSVVQSPKGCWCRCWLKPEMQITLNCWLDVHVL